MVTYRVRIQALKYVDVVLETRDDDLARQIACDEAIFEPNDIEASIDQVLQTTPEEDNGEHWWYDQKWVVFQEVGGEGDLFNAGCTGPFSSRQQAEDAVAEAKWQIANARAESEAERRNEEALYGPDGFSIG